MSSNHQLVAGTLPDDGSKIEEALDVASRAGYSVLTTTSCALNDTQVYYVATLAVPVEEPKQEKITGIRMKG